MKKSSSYISTIAPAAFVVMFTVVALVGVAFCGIANAAFTPELWNYSRGISVPSTAYDQGFTKIVLPDDISRDGQNFADVRIIANGTTEVPYFLTRNAVVRGGDISGRLLDKTVVNGEEQFIIDIGQSGQVYTGISMSVSNGNFRRQVKVYSSASLLPLSSASWNIITDKGFIFRFTDPTSGYSSGKDYVDFSAHTSQYIKVVVSSGEEGPVDVSAVNIYGERKIDVPSYSKDVAFSTFNNVQNHSTEVVIDLGEPGHISSAVTLSPTDKNYARKVLVYAADEIGPGGGNSIPVGPGEWNLVGQSSISRVSTSLFDGSSNRITYPEQKTRYIKLVIINDDNRPLILTGDALVEGPVISLIFETRAGEIYNLYYGNSKAVLPTYDISSISSYIEENSLPQSSVGSELVNPSYVAPALKVVPFTEAYPWLMNVFLVFVVVLIAAGIAWYMYEYVKKSKSVQSNSPKDD